MLGVWFSVDRTPSGPAPPAVRPAAMRPTAIQVQVPDLALRRQDAELTLSDALNGAPVLVHFWATWCPPCVEELPSLLAYARSTGTPVLAVSVDEDWASLRAFLGDAVPPEVLLADGAEVARLFDVRELPVTFVVDADGWLRWRLDGAQDWTSGASHDALNRLMGGR